MTRKGSFGRRMKAARKAAGVKQIDLEAQLGKTTTWASRMEAGVNHPPAKPLCDEIAGLIGAEPLEFWRVAALERLERLEPDAFGAIAALTGPVTSAAEDRLLEAARALDAAYPDDRVLERLARYLECSTDAGGVFILTRETTLILTEAAITHAR